MFPDMSTATLYKMWAECMRSYGVESSDWLTLPDAEASAWTSFAFNLRNYVRQTQEKS